MCIHLGIFTRTGVDYFINLPVRELLETAEEVNRIAEEQRVRAGNKNSR